MPFLPVIFWLISHILILHVGHHLHAVRVKSVFSNKFKMARAQNLDALKQF